jgi:signal transduction histidine kinase
MSTDTSATTAVSHDISPELTRELFDLAPEGIALVSPTGDTLLLNAAGRELLGSADVSSFGDAGTARVGRTEIEYHRTTLPSGLQAVHFRDVTQVHQRERQLLTFAQTAASIAFSHDLTALLDKLAAAVGEATAMVACTFLLYDDEGHLQQAGTAGEYPSTPDYGKRLRRCRDLGAPLLSDRAVRERRTLIESGWRRRTLADPRFAPLHDISHTEEWDTIVVVPVIFRHRVLGVFNGFYPLDREPRDADLPFLTAIADQAAVAVENSRLLAASERQAALEERHRLARELHDSVSQLLFSLSLRARALELTADSTRLAEDVHEIVTLSADALVEMRSLIFQLRPAALHDEGLVSAVRKHAAALAARSDIVIDLELPSEDLLLSEREEEQLFRVAQEALHNVAKHVPGAAVRLTIRIDGADLILEVHDDGRGFDPDRCEPGHYGLETMAERMHDLGGRLVVSSRSDGTTVRAVLPGVLG